MREVWLASTLDLVEFRKSSQFFGTKKLNHPLGLANGVLGFFYSF